MHSCSPAFKETVEAEPRLVRRARPLLGTIVEIAVDADSEHLLDAAFDVIAHLHSRMSIHEKASDIAALCRAAPGALIDVDPDTVAVLRIAANLHERSMGLFDITVGRRLVESGFLPKVVSGSSARYDGSAGDIEIVSDTQVRLRRSVLIDVGGVAKGYAVDRAVDRLISTGARHGIVNAGGDLRVFGDHSAAIEIRQPPGQGSSPRILRQSAIASSENSRSRKLRFGGYHTPHIDRHGKSVVINKTVSVVANSCAVADAMTKVAMLDPQLANRILRDHEGYVVGYSEQQMRRPNEKRAGARLARWQYSLLTWSGATLWLSGAIWLLLHYFGQVQGEFGVETHPAAPWMLRLHGLALIPALLGIGGLFVVHMPVGWSDRRQRSTGLLLAAILAVIVTTGYLLYYAGGDRLREWSSLLHWTLGLSVAAIFMWHQLLRRRKRDGSR